MVNYRKCSKDFRLPFKIVDNDKEKPLLLARSSIVWFSGNTEVMTQ